MKRTMVVLATLLTAAAVLTAAPTMAAPAGKLDVQVIGNVEIDSSDPTVATVRARYICEGGDGAHVWMSVKQAESRLPEQWLTEEGSGAQTAAWSHSHRDAVVCDGKWHVAIFTVDQLEWGWGELKPGQAWVQFCVIPPGSDPETGEIVWSMRFAAVK